MKARVLFVCLLSAVFLGVCVAGKDGELRIGVKKRPETCDIRTKNGDKLSMHYTVSLLNHRFREEYIYGMLTIHVSLLVIVAGNPRRWHGV